MFVFLPERSADVPETAAAAKKGGTDVRAAEGGGHRDANAAAAEPKTEERFQRRNIDKDMSPFPIDPPEIPDRGDHLPIKVPPKDIAQWPHRPSRYHSFLRAASADDGGTNATAERIGGDAKDTTTVVGQSPPETTTTSSTATTTTTTTRTARSTEAGKAAEGKGKRAVMTPAWMKHRPQHSAPPLYYPDFLWPVPFTQRSGGVPPGAAQSMYGWGPQMESWLYPRQGGELGAEEEDEAESEEAEEPRAKAGGGGAGGGAASKR